MDSFQPNCCSEHEELKVVMLCAPSDVPDLTIAENVGWDAAVNHVKAMDNFMGFKTTLENAGVKVIDYSEELSTDVKTVSEQLINRYFVRDLACVIGNSMFYGAVGSLSKASGVSTCTLIIRKVVSGKKDKQPSTALECGDVLILNKDAVLINIGMRTTLEAVESIKDRIFQEGFSEIAIIDLPRRSDTLHLDMNCNVTNANSCTRVHNSNTSF